VSDWAGVWLGVIAVSTVVMAAIQVGAIIYGARAARRLEVVLGRVEADLKPILERAQQVSADAARMSALAAVQVERVDLVFSDLTQRVEQTATMIQKALVSPAREGAALFAAFRATLAALRGLRGNGKATPPRGVEEDDALFIG
jgi:fibrillarin-like rRNA methylase